MKILLGALSLIYAGVSTVRNALFDSGLLRIYHSRLPVVSIGNISVGGNGKTPLVMYVVEELSRRGFKPVVLSRGYGGNIAGPVEVNKRHGANQVGDEPLLIAKKCAVPVVVARRRVAGAKYIERRSLGNVIVLDDGFQHRWLGRDLDIITVNCDSAEARQDFLSGKLLPLGRFREGRDAAFRRANVCVFAARKPVDRQHDEDAALFRLVPAGIQIYRSYFEPKGVFSLIGEEKLSPRPVVAICGIANPEGYFQTLRALGFALEGTRAYPDHQAISSGELQQLSEHYPNVPIVCTEKDAIKLPPQSCQGIFELRVGTKVMPGDAFITNISRVLLQRQQQARGSVIDLKAPAGDKTQSK